MTDSPLRTCYEEAKKQCKASAMSARAGEAILDLATMSLDFLAEECEPVQLHSRVPEKTYFTFGKGSVVARPANTDLFLADRKAIADLWGRWLAGALNSGEFAKLTYTVALAPCLAMEIVDRQNKKGPATSFECYIGHLFASAIGVNPTKRARLPVHGRDVLMTMDFLFDLGDDRPRIHLPVKMSTRERVVQAWAHQRLLNAAFGESAYRGVMVLFSETKLDSRSLEVVEICVPDQWLAYQALLSQLDRIYYFDVPYRYRMLTQEFPDVIHIRPFGDFFTEKETVLRP